MHGRVEILWTSHLSRFHLRSVRVKTFAYSTLIRRNSRYTKSVFSTGPKHRPTFRIPLKNPKASPSHPRSLAINWHAVKQRPFHSVLAEFRDQETKFAIGECPTL